MKTLCVLFFVTCMALLSVMVVRLRRLARSYVEQCEIEHATGAMPHNGITWRDWLGHLSVILVLAILALFFAKLSLIL